MASLITGLIAVLMVLVFLGFYAVKVGAVPLWIIILAILAMVVFDFYKTGIQGQNETER